MPSELEIDGGNENALIRQQCASLPLDGILDVIFASSRVGNTEALLVVKEQRPDCSQWIDAILMIMDMCGPQYFTNTQNVQRELLPFLKDKAHDEAQPVQGKYAQYLLAKCYENGLGVEKSAKKTLRCYKKSAEKGCVDSLFTLALRHLPCSEAHIMDALLEKDLLKAVDLFTQAAALGHAEAAYRLGLIYEGVSELSSTSSTEEKESIVEVIDENKETATSSNNSSQSTSDTQVLPGEDTKAHEHKVSKDLPLALHYYKLAASHGWVDAMFKLANCYFYGNFVPQDYTEAFSLFLKCAQRGVLQAQFLAGVCCRKGLGTEINEKRAFSLFKIAAGDANDNFCGGDALAQHALATCYDKGIGSEVNKSLALKLYKLSADRGVTKAQLVIAQKYHMGVDVKKSVLVAMKYFGMAAEFGNDPTAWFNLGLIHFLGENTTNFSPNKDPITDNNGAGDGSSLSGVVKADEEALRNKHRNLDKALVCFQKAADQGNSAAMYHLGIMYEHALGVERDLSRAIDFYRQSATQNDTRSLLRLGLFYMEGNEVVPKDVCEAVRYFEQSAQLGDPIAQFNLGLAHFNGDGLARDTHKAKEYFLQSASNGYSVAQYRLAKSFEDGDLGEKDVEQAKFFYAGSAQQGHVLAQEALARLS